MIPLLVSETRWYCPNCPQTAVTKYTGAHTRFHACAGIYGLTAPFLKVGDTARVYTVEREDYVHEDLVQVDSRGRPIMATITQREDGTNDVIVYAPTATAKGEARGLDD